MLLRRRLATFAIALPIAAAHAQRSGAISDSLEPHRPLPFQPGERLEYRVSYGPLHVGHGSMELGAGDTVRGVPTYHAIFQIAGGTLFFHVDDRIESWFDTTSLTSLRFTQRLHEGHYDAQRDFEMYPAEQRYERVGDTSYATVAAPLDDASFLYFVRTLSLRVGEEYRFDRYFQLAGNPIILRVLRTERITVPAGTFDAIVVQPLITTRGIFSQKGRAQVWLRADGGHEVLQMNSHLVFGSLTLVLTGETKQGQPVTPPPANSDSIRSKSSDTTLHLVSKRDLEIFAGAALATIAVAPFDGAVQHAMLAEDVRDNRSLHRTANGFAFVGGPGPFAGGAALYLIGRTANSNRVAGLGISLTEGVALAASLNAVVKGFSGRALPNVKSSDPGDFSFGRGFHEGNGSFVSFPSGHTAASFATAAVLVNTMQEWNPAAARVIAPAAYATATLVAVSRVYQNVHWASDLPLGAAIGVWSGRTAVAWQHHHPDNWLTRHLLGLTVVPSGHGLTITEAVSPQ